MRARAHVLCWPSDERICSISYAGTRMHWCVHACACMGVQGNHHLWVVQDRWTRQAAVLVCDTLAHVLVCVVR